MNRLGFLTRLPYLFSSALLGTIASYVIYINISRELNFEDFSTVSYWMNLGAILIVLYDLGINQFFQVNYDKDIKVLSQQLIGFKILLGLVITLVLFVVIREINLFFFLLSFWFVSFHAFFSYYLRLQRKFFFDIVFNIIYQVLFVLVFLLLLKTKSYEATGLFAWAHFGMRLILLLAIFGMLFFVFNQKFRLLGLAKELDLLKKISGFSFLSILLVVMQNVDSLILYKVIDDAALFSKISMVIKIGFLNFAFFDSFITLTSAFEQKTGKNNVDKFYSQFKLCVLFGILVAFCIHVVIVALPYLVGDKWLGISDISSWAIVNNIVIYMLLFLQFRLLAQGKIKTVAYSIICFIFLSSVISYFFVSYQSYFLLSAVLKLAVSAYYFFVIIKTVRIENGLNFNTKIFGVANKE